MISGDRGFAGAYNSNMIRYTLLQFRDFTQPVSYIAVGRKVATCSSAGGRSDRRFQQPARRANFCGCFRDWATGGG